MRGVDHLHVASASESPYDLPQQVNDALAQARQRSLITMEGGSHG